jgi:hypothetical protein
MFGIPWSLSQTFYLFKEKKPCYRFFFPFMMISISFLLIPSWLEISEYSNWQFLSFLAPIGILFTGFVPTFNQSKMENIVHTCSAILGAIFALLWVILVAKSWFLIAFWLIIIFIISLITKTIKTGYVYWIENIAFMATFSSIVLYSLTL